MMKRSMTVSVLCATLGLASAASAQKLDRSKRPVTPPAPQFKLPPITSQTLPNGLVVRVMENHALPLVSAQDFKRAFDGDEGPNTGGMGAYAPVSGVGASVARGLVEAVHAPVLAELASRGAPFVGLLYAGLMLTPDGPRVLEFNCRFGDPETQAIVPMLDADLLEVLAAAARGDTSGIEIGCAPGATVTVVLAAEKYPADGDRGGGITGVDAAEALGGLVFHAGTARHGERLVTNGGRILAVTGSGPSVSDARSAAYEAAGRISFPGMRFRSDIAAAAASGASVDIVGSS